MKKRLLTLLLCLLISLVLLAAWIFGAHNTWLYWSRNLQSESAFWETYFNTNGHGFGNTFKRQLRADEPFPEDLRSLIPVELNDVHVLDVGAGPISQLGPVWPGKRLSVTAVDPLAPEYDQILAKHGISPRVRTVLGDGEHLTDKFPTGTFDLAFAQNAVDHAYDPMRVIEQMVEVVKPGAFVVLKHFTNEAENENYAGLHQWNFSATGSEFIISSRHSIQSVNKLLGAKARIYVKIVPSEYGKDWLVVKIHKAG